MKNIENRRLSVEIEVEHRKYNRDELKNLRKMVYNKFKDDIDYFRVLYDYSLYNGGMELTGNINHPKQWKPVIDFLHELKFIVNTRTGFHIHIDCSYITTLDQLKSIIINIAKIQESNNRNLNNNISAYHNMFPSSVLTRLIDTHSINEFIQIYIKDLRGGVKLRDMQKDLDMKGSEHNYWVDLTPLFRKLVNFNPEHSKYRRAIGSIEIRGKASNSTFGDEVIAYQKFIKKLSELIFLAKYILKDT